MGWMIVQYFNIGFAGTLRAALLFGAARCRAWVVLVCLALMVVGCSSAERVVVEESGEDLLKPPEQVEDWPRPPFAGMWVNHPNNVFPADDKWIYGTVSVEPPCVYLTNVTNIMAATSGVSWEGRRLALSLIYPDVRFDESTYTVWNPWLEDDIPISHGDRVFVGAHPFGETVGGKEPGDLHLFWDACAAHASARPVGLWSSLEWLCVNRPSGEAWPFGNELVRMCNEDTPWNQREVLEEQGIVVDVEPFVAGRVPKEPPPVAELAPPPVFDMYPYHRDVDMELELSKLVGVLLIEPSGFNNDKRVFACIYPTDASDPQAVLWGDSWKHVDPDGQPLATALHLPYPQISFDEQAWVLWNGDVGPMTTGDRVIADFVEPPDYNDGYGVHKQPHETLESTSCDKTNASATVLDIQPVTHYCTNNPPTRHSSQCDYAMNPDTQTQNQLTLPES